MLKTVLISVVCGLIFFTVGILIGHFAIEKEESIPRWVNELQKDVDEGFIANFINEVDNRNIEENLRWVAERQSLYIICEETFCYVSKNWLDRTGVLRLICINRDRLWDDIRIKTLPTGSWRRSLTWPPLWETRRLWLWCWADGRMQRRAWTTRSGRITWSTCPSPTPTTPIRSPWVSPPGPDCNWALLSTHGCKCWDALMNFSSLVENASL